ncbi:aldolase [bacterium]|nr:aldolase [bacterium]NIN92076.1 aldolase [bacterium]NIO18289.1 aldolase [bacterium]NIO73263.1 aldolase [bacterium]
MNTLPIKEKMNRGEFVVGPFMKSRDPAMVEIVGLAGFDFAILDMEHSALSIESVEDLIRMAEVRGIDSIVRVPEISESAISGPLDAGASGVLVPHVDTRKQAEEVVYLSKFSPLGERGMDVFARAADYSHLPKEKYLEQANRKTLLIVQIEGKKGVENLDDILRVKGVDTIFIGPYDLSQSLGVPGEIDHPKVTEKIKQVVGKVRKAGLSLGIYVDDVQTARKWIDLGVQFIALLVDSVIFFQACQALVAPLRKSKR